MAAWTNREADDETRKIVSGLFFLRRFTLVVILTSCSLGAALGQGRQGQRRPDFLFDPPTGSAGFRLGGSFPRADSQIFDFVTEQLTLDRDDFRAMVFGVDLAFRLNDYLDVVAGFDYSRSTSSSEVRDFVDESNLPITQQTRFSRLPLTGTARFFPAGKGEQVGQYAWIPRRVAPYIGAGGGVTWYQFQQSGEFVDFRDLTIFADRLTSDGWAPIVHVLGGLEINLNRRLFLGLEARYAWADAELGLDFSGFDPIDLSGFQTTGGLHIRF